MHIVVNGNRDRGGQRWQFPEEPAAFKVECNLRELRAPHAQDTVEIVAFVFPIIHHECGLRTDCFFAQIYFRNHGGEDGSFSSLSAKDGGMPILNLEQGHSVPDWGRMIFYVADVDAFWEYLRGKGFNPENPRDASWGERYFHMPDPDGHELSFARPI